jgi:signal transduction histidine kinase
MRRLFFSLYAVVAAALVAFVLAAPWLLNNVLRGELVRGNEQTAMAAQYLFEQELHDVPIADWPAHSESLKARFGYQLDLLPLAEIKTSARNMRLLREGLAVVSEEDQIDFMLLPLRGSQYVVRAYIAQREQEHAQRTAEGFFYLLEKLLARHPNREGVELLQQMERQFGVEFRRTRLQDVLSVSDRERLRRGEVVAYDVEEPGERYLQRVANSDQILQIGPFPRDFLERAIQYLAWITLGIVIAIALYLWVRPLWRDMVALDRGALAIGQGRLDTRVQVSVRSPVRALADTFNAMAQRVHELLKAQKEMADAVSHELCTPISRLRFGVEMLVHPPPGTDQQRYVQGILRDIDELEGLVDEALTYSRLTTTDAHLSMQEVELAEWLAEIVRSVPRSANAPELSSEINTQRAVATFDAQLMARALSNIIRNALRYARSAIRVTIADNGGRLELTVEDDGPGIPLPLREAIFEPFYRIDPSRQRQSGGHGLGLAIVKRICDWHRVEVTVASSPLGGALFRLQLPLA